MMVVLLGEPAAKWLRGAGMAEKLPETFVSGVNA